MKNLIKVLATCFFSPSKNVIVTYGVYHHPVVTSSKVIYTINGSKANKNIDQNKINAIFNRVAFDKQFK